MPRQKRFTAQEGLEMCITYRRSGIEIPPEDPGNIPFRQMQANRRLIGRLFLPTRQSAHLIRPGSFDGAAFKITVKAWAEICSFTLSLESTSLRARTLYPIGLNRWAACIAGKMGGSFLICWRRSMTIRSS